MRQSSRLWPLMKVSFPTINLKNQDPECDLDYIPNVGRKKQVEYARSMPLASVGITAS